MTSSSHPTALLPIVLRDNTNTNNLHLLFISLESTLCIYVHPKKEVSISNLTMHVYMDSVLPNSNNDKNLQIHRKVFLLNQKWILIFRIPISIFTNISKYVSSREVSFTNLYMHVHVFDLCGIYEGGDMGMYMYTCRISL